LSASGLYVTAATATAVFVALSVDLPCISEQELAPVAIGGAKVSAYDEAAPDAGDQSTAIKEVITVAGGSVGADADVILVRIGRTLLFFAFINASSQDEHSMLTSVIDRVGHS